MDTPWFRPIHLPHYYAGSESTKWPRRETKDTIHSFSEAELTQMLRERMGNQPPPEQPKTTQSGETLN